MDSPHGLQPTRKRIRRATLQLPSAPGLHFKRAVFLTYSAFHWNTPFAPSRFRDIATFEHFHVNQLGDVFVFVDLANLSTFGRGDPGAGLDVYGEVSYRVSLSKITGKNSSYSLVRDFYPYSGTLEAGHFGTLDKINQAFGSGIDTTHFAHLHGASIDIGLPKFQLSSVSVYWRDDIIRAGSTYQVTAAWALPLTLGSSEFSFGGFVDLSGPEGGRSTTFHTSPQFLYKAVEELPSFMGSLNIGVEVDIWINEFGTSGQHEFTPQLLGKAAF